jgi:hypothetical protein
MKHITVSYYKIDSGRLNYNDLEEIHFRNVEWIELTRDEVSNYETWQWIPSKLVFCVKSIGQESSPLALYTKQTPRKISMGILHLINWSRKLSICNVYLNNHERSSWAFVLNQLVKKFLCVYCIKSPRELFVGIVLKYYVIKWSLMFSMNIVCILK